MAKITMINGEEISVSDLDYEVLNQFEWRKDGAGKVITVVDGNIVSMKDFIAEFMREQLEAEKPTLGVV
jgi:hypothetical protein